MRLLFILSVLLFSTPSHAVWWWAGSAIKHLSTSDNKKSKPRKSIRKKSCGYGEYYAYQAGKCFDGYNSYHQHPEGRLSKDSPVYNENLKKLW